MRIADLHAWKHCKVDLILQIIQDVLALLVLAAHTLAEEDHGPPWPPQGFVGGRGDDVTVLKWRRDHICNGWTAISNKPSRPRNAPNRMTMQPKRCLG